MTRWTLLLLLSLAPALVAGEITGVRVRIRSTDLNPEWFKDVPPQNRDLVLKDGTTEFPPAVAPFDKPADLEVIHQRFVMQAGRATPSPCGVMIHFTPTKAGDKVTLTGHVTLRRTSPDDTGPPNGYRREKTYFKCTLAPGGTKKLLVAEDGDVKQHLELEVTPVDDQGQPAE